MQGNYVCTYFAFSTPHFAGTCVVLKGLRFKWPREREEERNQSRKSKRRAAFAETIIEARSEAISARTVE